MSRSRLESRLAELKAAKAPAFVIGALQNAIDGARHSEPPDPPPAPAPIQEPDLWASDEPAPSYAPETDASVERYFDRAGEAG